MRIHPFLGAFKGEISQIPADKSISHRCAIFSLLSDGTSEILGFLRAEDTMHSLQIAQKLGAKVQIDGDLIKITPPKKIAEPNEILECGNSGTSIRLFLGLLASCEGFYVLSGDKYLNSRPMKRVCEPLSKVGAKFDGRMDGDFAPISVRGRKLDYFEYESPISSAQVKTAMILAALNSNGCKFSEPELSRDHSERLLLGMGADLEICGFETKVKPLKKPLEPIIMEVPGDPSSAFFYAVLAAITPNSKILLKNILLNKTRIEAFKILAQMGAKVQITETSSKYETIGDILVEYAPLSPVNVETNISWMIDEAPALAIAFAFANGKSQLKNAKELHVKECDRISVMVSGLKAAGIEAQELEDGFIITGGKPKFAKIEPHGDHRIAMSFAILGTACGMEIENGECYKTSFPNFAEILRNLGVEIED